MHSEGHWMIEPHPVPVDEHHFERTMTVPHILFRANEALQSTIAMSDGKQLYRHIAYTAYYLFCIIFLVIFANEC